ncbi:MAG TPA: hypothetical protein VEI02_09395 [Planctomycetota bacterium]|nr:hypothetical protein [Planctomycetota bacterium]
MRVAVPCVLFAAAAVAAGQAPGAASAADLVLVAARVAPVDGPAVDGGVAIADGRIVAVGPAALAHPLKPTGTKLEFPGATLFPGLVDAGSYVGVRRERDETTTAFEVETRMADALDPFHPGFARNRAAGVTTLHATPGDRSVIGGRTAVLKVAPGGARRVLRADAGLKASFVQAAYSDDRAPTSVQGALDLLNRPTPDLAERLKPWTDPTSTLFVAARSERDVRAPGRLSRLGGRKILMTGPAAGEALDDVAAYAAGVVLDPLPPSLAPYERRRVADLCARLPFAFASYAPLDPPTVLRISAATAVACGVPEDRVERALTLGAATLLGVEKQVGSLAVGKDGDVCVFSGPPCDPRSRLLATVQDGRVVWRAPAD